MIAGLLPDEVRCVVRREDGSPSEPLFPAEEALLVQAGPKRRAEFTTVRGCARRALAGLGLPPVPVLPGQRGAPQWPAGVVGSLTHCEGFRAAAVARAGRIRSLGIDAEPNLPLPPGVREVVLRPAELRLPDGPQGSGEVHLDRLVFSAKESVFKAWYPLTGLELDFLEAELRLSPAAPGSADGSFEARLLRSAPGLSGTLHGRWSVRDGIVATAVVVNTG
ncbi:4'-phosphopantetheinyl transferase [Kitasatospora sp. NPDC059673]|uniref:4'-phosphopantetheinyl transferase family protein n=1 Tax=Kitasatospora sp. NPDC059673 TaxID=3346901 RepID=UPI003685725F